MAGGVKWWRHIKANDGYCMTTVHPRPSNLEGRGPSRPASRRQSRRVQLTVSWLQWTEVRRRSDVALESGKCKPLQYLRECGQISDRSVSSCRSSPRFFSSGVTSPVRIEAGDWPEVKETLARWQMTAEISSLQSFIKGVDMMSRGEVLLGTRWIRRETSSHKWTRAETMTMLLALDTVHLKHQRVTQTGWRQSRLVQTAVCQRRGHWSRLPDKRRRLGYSISGYDGRGEEIF